MGSNVLVEGPQRVPTAGEKAGLEKSNKQDEAAERPERSDPMERTRPSERLGSNLRTVSTERERGEGSFLFETKP